MKEVKEAMQRKVPMMSRPNPTIPRHYRNLCSRDVPASASVELVSSKNDIQS